MEFDLDKIVNYLKPYCSRLNSLYVWEPPSDKYLINGENDEIFSVEERNKLLSEKNMFERNVTLKNILSKKIYLTDSPDNKKIIFKWIVNKWGGINVKDIDKLHTRIINFLNQRLDTTKLNFNGISSISKVLSFISPEKYIIYDARVAYSMNWILLKTNASEMFFPMPESRNSKLSAIDISTLIRLSKVHNYKNNLESKRIISYSDKKVFIEKSKAYTILCDLILEINKNLWQDNRKEYPFYTEMLLFSLADNIIFSDVLNFCNLDIV